jgi:hypothetical protein
VVIFVGRRVLQGREAGRWGWGFVWLCGFRVFASVPCGYGVDVLCVSTPHSFGWWPEAKGLLAPPSSLLRLNPSVSIPKEGDHHRSPFQAMLPCGLTMLPQSNGLIGRNVTV